MKTEHHESTKHLVPVEIKIIFDKLHYRCELRESGKFFKSISGEFLKGDRSLIGRVNKLTEVMSDGLNHLVALGTKNINDYSIHSSIKPVPDVYARITK